MSERLDPQNSEKKNPWVMALGASQLGILVVTGLMGGLWLDQKLNSTPLFGLLGLACGFGSGILFLMKLVKGARKNAT